MKIWKNKKIMIAAGVVIVVAVLGYWRYGAQPTEQIITAMVKRGDLVQSVEPSGSVKSRSEMNLNFDTTGKIALINVKVGQTVKAGELLARLYTGSLDAAVSQAAADLAKARGSLAAYEAGSTLETIAQYEAEVQKAEANLAKARADLANLKASLKQTLDNAQANQVNTLQGTITTLETAMTDMDTVLGLENTMANDTFDNAITSLDQSSSYFSVAKSDFTNARAKINSAKAASNSLVTLSSSEEIASATAKIKEALEAAATALNSTWTVLDKLDFNSPSHNITISTVTSKKTTIDTDRAAVTTKRTSVMSGEQAIATAKLNYSGEAGSAGASQVAQYEATVQINEAALASAQATLAGKKAPPRPVDLESYRAAVSSGQAALSSVVANRNKAIIYAPVDGIITQKNNEVGENNSAATAVLVLLPHSDFEIEVNVSESDITKVKVGQGVDITLDAYGEEHIFKGKVISVDPAETLISDVVYYRVKAVIDPAETLAAGGLVVEEDIKDIKSGMTANVTIFTDKKENVLMIPERAVEEKNDVKVVRVLTDAKRQKWQEREVTTGLAGNDGMIEIKTGLNEGEQVITYLKSLK